jgi:hypothetical protein
MVAFGQGHAFGVWMRQASMTVNISWQNSKTMIMMFKPFH